MNKVFTLILCSLFASYTFAQSFQGTIKPGTTANSLICAIKSSTDLTDKPVNIQLTIAIPISVGTRPTMTILDNKYSAYFSNANIFQTATYLTDYIYLIDLTSPTLTTNKAYTADAEDSVLELSFAGNTGDVSQIRLVQIPDGLASTGAGSENGNYNFYTQFAVAGETTNTTAMFYTFTGGIVVNNPIGYSGYSSVSSGMNVLPVRWVNFSVQKQNESALLTWEVANQINSNHYEVEAGNDGKVFSTIGKVATVENSNTYNYLDADLLKRNGKYIYYRIKQVDKDGRFTYTNIESLLLDRKEFSFGILANPITGRTLQLYISSVNDGRGVIRVFDLNGKSVYQNTINWMPGYSNKSIQLPELSSGSYFVNLSTENRVFTIKFIK